MRAPLAVAGAVSALALLTACGQGEGGAGGAPVSAQIAHPNGAVLQVLSVNAGRERTAVAIRITNGRDNEIALNNGSEQSYLLTDAGEKLLLAAPSGNADLDVPAGQSMDGVLVFAGELPRGDRATLVLNAGGDARSAYSTSPRFEVVLPLDGAFKGGSGAATSALSNMRPNPATRLGPAAASGSSLTPGGQAASSLQAVEALKTELGATETARGSVVALAGDVTFDFDKDTIREAAKPTLDRLAQLVQASGASSVTVEGHTDSEGADAYNQSLSERRARAVMAYLTSKGVPADRLTAAGLGETRAVASNDTDAGRQSNRRVEVILPRAASTPASSAPRGASSLSEVR